TTFVFRVRNVPAALYKELGGFATNGVNMTKLEIYMVGGNFFATQFYADVEGHPDDRALVFALEELAFFSKELTVLGVYPAHPFRETFKEEKDEASYRDAAEKSLNAALQTCRRGFDRFGRLQYLARRAARAAVAPRHFPGDRDHPFGPVCRTRHVVRDLIGRTVLLLQGKRDGGRVAVNFTHAVGIAPDGVDRHPCRVLYSLDLAGNLLCCLGGLHCERFDFGCDNSEAAASLARACGFDRSIERKQICLPGNVSDQVDDFDDLLNCLGETGHMLVGGLSFGDAMRRDLRSLADLTSNLADPWAHFLGSGRGR